MRTKMSREWHREPQFLAIIGKSLLKPTNLEYMEVPSDGGRVQNWIMDLVWHLLKHRAWSSVVRHTMVPDCYAGILSDDVAAQKEACDNMQLIWQIWMALEGNRHERKKADGGLVESLDRSSAIRMLHVLFERGKFQPNCLAGRRCLRGMLEKLPDNKFVEDIHRTIKMDAKETPTASKQALACSN